MELLFNSRFIATQLARQFVCLFVCLLEYNPKNYTPPSVFGGK